MPDWPLVLLVAVVLLALVFDYTNGMHDSANAIATVVSTKVLSPRAAVCMAAVLNLLGALTGGKVAETVGNGIVNAKLVKGCLELVLAALLGAILWNLLTWYFGLPSSSSHALIGGLIGAALTYRGMHAVNVASIVKKVMVPLVTSPLAGFVFGYLFMLTLAWSLLKAHPRKANLVFRRLQAVSAAGMALSHGLNDAQKTMGVITLALFLGNQISALQTPTWVKLACALAMAAGTASGGWKIIKTMGHKIFKIEPVHGFAAETGTALVIMTASALGAPISTTHVISSSVLGVGASKRLSAVRWGVAGRMLTAWVLTIPAAAAVAAICMWVLARI